MAQVSEHEDRMLNLQFQMRQNNEDLKSFLSDLDNWEDEMKQIDAKLKVKKPTEETQLPPVRNSLEKKKLKKRVKKKDGAKAKPKRISGYDYRSWDKFDVDKACESDKSSSDAEYETDEEWEVERKKQAAVLEKDKGNEYFKKGDYANAIECYTKGADLDPTNPLLPANRAMALLKQDKFGAAELDCSVALTLDPLYTKAYLRRASARMGLKKYIEAKVDFEKVLQLEPQNKKAKSDLEQIEKELAKEKLVTHSDTSSSPSVGIVKAISKHPSERSMKPLRRITIEEVGLEEMDIKSAVAKTEATQSQAKRDIVEKEGESFQRFTANSPADIAAMSVRNTHLNGDILDNSTAENVVRKSAKICDKTKLDNDTVPAVNDANTEHSMESATKTKNSKNKKSENQKPRAVDVSASGTGRQVSPRDNPVPVNSVQFQADYRRLKTDQEAFYHYFKTIPASDYTKLFGQFLDADVLQTILHVVKDCYIPYVGFQNVSRATKKNEPSAFATSMDPYESRQDPCSTLLDTKLQKLLANRMDPDETARIHAVHLSNGDKCFECLQSLASVKRFSMVVMFMSKKDKQVLTDIFAHLRGCGQHTEAEIISLASKYDLR